jgi:hypothetical protein
MAMSTMTRARALQVVEQIQQDMEADTNRWEGAAFTGRNVSEMFGEIRGTIAGLAHVVEKILDEMEET